MKKFVFKLKQGISNQAGTLLYRTVENIDGEKHRMSLLPYPLAEKIKLFCLQRLIAAVDFQAEAPNRGPAQRLRAFFCHRMGLVLWHLIGLIDGEKNKIKIIPHDVGYKLKLFYVSKWLEQ